MRTKASLAAVLAALVVAGPMIDVALAKKKPKARFSAIVAGKRLKSIRRAASGRYASTGFGVGGQALARHRVSRALSVDCVGVNLKTVALPASFTRCLGNYGETNTKGGLKQWTSLGVDVTIQSFDGRKLVGTFRGLIEPSTSIPTEPAVTVEGGSFQVFVVDLGV